MLSKEVIQIIMALIVVAGLVYYILKQTGYVEGLENKENEPKPEIKTTTIRRIIS